MVGTRTNLPSLISLSFSLPFLTFMELSGPRASTTKEVFRTSSQPALHRDARPYQAFVKLIPSFSSAWLKTLMSLTVTCHPLASVPRVFMGRGIL